MPHFRALFSSDEWFTSADLYDERTDSFREVDVEIVRVTKGVLNNFSSGGKEKGKTKKTRPVLYLKSLRTGNELPKPLGTGATICETIATIAGTGEIRRWPGVKITLFVSETKVGGVPRPCIRVRPNPPSGPAPAPAPAPATGPLEPDDRRGDGRSPDAEEQRLIAEEERRAAR